MSHAPTRTEPERPDVPVVGHEELRRRLRDTDLVLLDVLPESSYREAHIPGSRNLPLAEISRRAAATLPDAHADIVVYCAGPT